LTALPDRLRYTWQNWSRIAPASQGRHPDPADPAVARPDPTRWSAERRRAWDGPEMAALRWALAEPGTADTRAGVLGDLSLYFGLSEDECLTRCLDWEAASVAEWASERRDSDAARVRFYRSTTSWVFDLLWWAYLQSEGFGDPQTVMAAQFARRAAPHGRHLDFGSGVGVTSQVFAALGYATDLADISASLLEFARFRLDRRRLTARYIDLTTGALPEGAYSVVTAIDTLAHVPDVAATAELLHTSIAPGGLLFAGIDARPAGPASSWHLVGDEWTARRELQHAGFRPVRRLGPLLVCYRRVGKGALVHRLRDARDRAVLTSRWSRTARRGVVTAVGGARRALRAGSG